ALDLLVELQRAGARRRRQHRLLVLAAHDRGARRLSRDSTCDDDARHPPGENEHGKVDPHVLLRGSPPDAPGSEGLLCHLHGSSPAADVLSMCGRGTRAAWLPGASKTGVETCCP